MKPSNPSSLHLIQQQDLPRGIQSIFGTLPNPDLAALWNSIVIEDGIKERLLAQAVLNYTLRPEAGPKRCAVTRRHLIGGPPRNRQDLTCSGACQHGRRAVEGFYFPAG